MNRYKDGQDYISYHKDNEDGWDHWTGLMTFAVGVMRNINFVSDSGKRISIPHLHG